MSKIKLIIFDLSGVCFSIEEPPYLEVFIKKYKLEARREDFLKQYFDMLKTAERGEMTGIELWNQLLLKYKITADSNLIIKEMIDLKVAITEVLDIAKKLKENYTVVYLTNYNKDYWDEILKRFDFKEWFSWGAVSYEIGFRKPEKEGFEFILKKAGVNPDEAIFIDDFPKNLEEAKSLGINIINFENKKDLIEDLNILGIR